MCERNDIEFIVAIPPNFRKVTAGFAKRLKQLVGNSGTVWMYDEAKPEYSNSDYFFDNAHLQKTGSIVYTAEFASFLKNKD